MAAPWAKTFYSSARWQACREGYLKTQDYICERCGEPAKVVHHKTYINRTNINDASVTLNWNNLEALCGDCHAEEHSDAHPTRKDCRFNEFGELIHIKPLGE